MLPLSARLSAVGAVSAILTAIAAIPYATDAQAQPNKPNTEQRGVPAQPNRPVIDQRTAPPVVPAPVFRTAPVQHAAPPVVVPPPTPQPHIDTGRPVPVTPPHDGNNPNIQLSNPNALRPNLPLTNPSTLAPNLRLNDPSAFRPNPQINNPNALRPNLPLDNPSALAPNLPLNDPSALRSNSQIHNPSTLAPNLPPNDPSTLRPNVPPNNPTVLRVNPSRAIPPQGPNTLRHGPGQPPVNSALLRPGTGGSQQIRPAFPAVNLHNKFWPIFKDSKFMWVGGHRRFFTPVGLLGVVLLGGSYWYPDGYVSMEGPACTGYTQNGCQLQWRMVDFEDGGSEPQCVQYCPQVGPPPPPEQVATLPPPPPLPENGACQVTIYSEPNFTGTSAPTGASQPDLSETGWRNEISSIVVRAGIWDFFTDENFNGESMRLPPGTYPTLSEEWTRRIGSFMCVQPGARGIMLRDRDA